MTKYILLYTFIYIYIYIYILILSNNFKFIKIETELERTSEDLMNIVQLVTYTEFIKNNINNNINLILI